MVTEGIAVIAGKYYKRFIQNIPGFECGNDLTDPSIDKCDVCIIVSAPTPVVVARRCGQVYPVTWNC